MQTSVNLDIVLDPDTTWIQVADSAKTAVIFSVQAGQWAHNNWSSRASDFAPNFTLTFADNNDGTHTVTVQGKPGTLYEEVFATAEVGPDGRVIAPGATPLRNHGASMASVCKDAIHCVSHEASIFDLHGNRLVGASLVGAPPGVYIIRQGSQTRTIVVR
jgi:hypothetical protein